MTTAQTPEPGADHGGDPLAYLRSYRIDGMEILDALAHTRAIAACLLAREHHARLPGQSRRHSLVESIVNVAIGLAVAWLANLLIFPALGYPITIADASIASVIFTAISIARSYMIRRFFNRKENQ